METKGKKAVRAVLVVLGILVFAGGPLFFGYVFASLGMLPLYAVKVYPVAAIGLVAALILTNIGYLKQPWIKRVWLCFLAVCVGCGGYIGWRAYHASIPTVDDRSLMLYEYEPFSEGNKLVTLEEPATLQFDLAQTYDVRVDGATALYPVYAAFVQELWPEKEYPIHEYQPGGDGYGMVTCSNTVNAYERLIKGKTDVIFVAGPSKAQQEMAEQAGMEFHLTPVGREAFVFFVNSKNPVDGLTVEQIQKIYTGEITNWSEVGGKNQSIRPFQRAENSGSQTALQKLMGDIPIMEPEEEDRIAGMGGIIREVASYRNYKNALGFSFRYYASEMEANDEIKLLALNGVAPTKETIRDGSYPISSEFYAVTAAPIGEPAPQETNESLSAFLDWVCSEQGQAIVEKTGYVALNG